jgi:hypothetical protein
MARKTARGTAGLSEFAGPQMIRQKTRQWLQNFDLAVVSVLAALQFVFVTHDNPPVVPSTTIYAVESMPANVKSILERSCQDCHSNQTHWPWYSYVAPVSWLVTHDVHQARGKMNFSEWGAYSKKKQARELEEICNQLMDGDMPDGTYAFIHRHARLTPEERDAVCAWTDFPRP